MYTIYIPETEKTPEPSSEQLQTARLIIRSATEKNQPCYWADIVKENNGRLPLAVFKKVFSQRLTPPTEEPKT